MSYLFTDHPSVSCHPIRATPSLMTSEFLLSQENNQVMFPTRQMVLQQSFVFQVSTTSLQELRRVGSAVSIHAHTSFIYPLRQAVHGFPERQRRAWRRGRKTFKSPTECTRTRERIAAEKSAVEGTSSKQLMIMGGYKISQEQNFI